MRLANKRNSLNEAAAASRAASQLLQEFLEKARTPVTCVWCRKQFVRHHVEREVVFEVSA